MGCDNTSISPTGIPPPDAQMWVICIETGLLQVPAITDLVPTGVDVLGHRIAQMKENSPPLLYQPHLKQSFVLRMA